MFPSTAAFMIVLASFLQASSQCIQCLQITTRITAPSVTGFNGDSVRQQARLARIKREVESWISTDEWNKVKGIFIARKEELKRVVRLVEDVTKDGYELQDEANLANDGFTVDQANHTMTELTATLKAFIKRASDVIDRFDAVPEEPTKRKEDIKQYKAVQEIAALFKVDKDLSKLYMTKGLGQIIKWPDGTLSKLGAAIEYFKDFEFNYNIKLAQMVDHLTKTGKLKQKATPWIRRYGMNAAKLFFIPTLFHSLYWFFELEGRKIITSKEVLNTIVNSAKQGLEWMGYSTTSTTSAGTTTTIGTTTEHFWPRFGRWLDLSKFLIIMITILVLLTVSFILWARKRMTTVNNNTTGQPSRRPWIREKRAAHNRNSTSTRNQKESSTKTSSRPSEYVSESQSRTRPTTR